MKKRNFKAPSGETIAFTELASGYELTVIAACVIGGVSLRGGRGTVAVNVDAAGPCWQGAGPGRGGAPLASITIERLRAILASQRLERAEHRLDRRGTPAPCQMRRHRLQQRLGTRGRRDDRHAGHGEHREEVAKAARERAERVVADRFGGLAVAEQVGHDQPVVLVEPVERVLQLLALAPGLVVVDEAYLEFVRMDDAIDGVAARNC